MNELENINFEYIELIANYIDGKMNNKEDKKKLQELLKIDKFFREMYTEAFEYLKNLDYKDLHRLPDNLKESPKEEHPTIVFKVLKNIIEIISNSISNLNTKQMAVEYLSGENNKIVSQKFALGKGIIEIKSQESLQAKIIVEAPLKTKLVLINRSNNDIIIDANTIQNVSTLQDIEKGAYTLSIDENTINFEIR